VSVHTSASARAAIAAAGGPLVVLPAFFPDVHPIASAFAKIKQALRRAEPRSDRAVLGCFAHVGFRLPGPGGQP
jgi:hypothetical protein